MHTVLIIEDNMAAREELVDMIIRYPQVKLSGLAKNRQEAVAAIINHEYDLIFLSINVLPLSEIELLNKLNNRAYIIFTSSSDKNAVDAINQNGAIDFLLKPFTGKQYEQSMEKFFSIVQPPAPRQVLSLSFRENDKYYFVPYEEIVYLSANAKKTVIHTEKRDYETSSLLKEIEQKLPPAVFTRIHRKYIVNIRYISYFKYFINGQYNVFLKNLDDDVLPVGRTYSPQIKNRLRIGVGG